MKDNVDADPKRSIGPNAESIKPNRAIKSGRNRDWIYLLIFKIANKSLLIISILASR